MPAEGPPGPAQDHPNADRRNGMPVDWQISGEIKISFLLVTSTLLSPSPIESHKLLLRSTRSFEGCLRMFAEALILLAALDSFGNPDSPTAWQQD